MGTRIRGIRSVKGPAILFAIALVLIIGLLVLWNVVLAVDYRRIRELARAASEAGTAFHWTFIALGSGLFVATIVLLSVLGAQLFSEIRFTQRLSTFIAMFTHELNSPLASIKLFAQTMRASDVSREDRERFLDAILADVERLGAQISNVLRAAQVDSPQGMRIAPEPADLRDVLAGYVATKRASLERLDARARLALADGGGTAVVELDEVAFRQALDNLLDNAVKFAGEAGPRIEIAIVPADAPGCIAVEVRDEGQGIDPRDAARIFDRFARAAHSAEAARKPGTGLGLWIVRSIVRAHGGAIDVRSPGVGRGATFRIELPVARGEAPLRARSSAAVEGVP